MVTSAGSLSFRPPYRLPSWRGTGVGTIAEYAESLVDAEAWPFWWD
jgi:hypothetical protein